MRRFLEKAKHWARLQSLHSQTVRLRKFPYPYKSAISISNDCEYMTWETKLPLYRLLCGEDGLNLEISDSLFFYVTNALCHSSFSYFHGTSSRPTGYAPVLREMNQAGYLDAIHAYGDFDDGGFKRAMAERIVEECAREGMRFTVWSNHGSDKNYQNLGHCTLAEYQQGDNPASPFYHLDLLRHTGVRYHWVDGGYVAKPFEPGPLLCREQARDGSSLTLFRRYRGLVGKPAPNASSLPEQVRTEDIDAVIANGQPCIYYQHLGCGRKTAAGVFEANCPPFFSPEGVRVLEYLAKVFHEGKCLVTTVSRLLRYLEVRDSLSVTLEDGEAVLSSADANMSADDLAGVTVYVSRPETMRLVWRGKDGAKRPLSSKVFLDTDSGEACIGVPWQRLGGFRW